MRNRSTVSNGLFVSILSVVFAFILFWSHSAHAQWADQTLALHLGWNAVFLEVDPLDRSPQAVFEGLPVESVWMWNPPSSTVQFIQNPSQLVPKDPEWLVWFPPDNPETKMLTSLYAILGGRPYLIKIRGTGDAALTVTGKPGIPNIRWKPDSFNFVGFHLKPGQEPAFGNFFAPSAAHGRGQPKAYRLNSSGDWEAALPTDSMQAGAGYWVHCKTASDYTGPLSVKPPTSEGVDFDAMIVKQTILIQNLSAIPATVSVTQIPSSPNGPAVTGMVPLSRWVPPPVDTAGWNSFDAPIQLSFAAGEKSELNLAIRRTALSGPGVYQSLLEIGNNAGMRILVPVSTGKKTVTSGGRDVRTEEPTDGPPNRTGLWVGFAEINKVNQPAVDGDDGNATKPTASEFAFRLMVHVADDGSVKLLREVIQLWKPPVEDASGNITEPGRVVLITDSSLLNSSDYTGTGVRDGRSVGRRISSAVFGFNTCSGDPVKCLPQLAMSGAFAVDGSLTASHTTSADDPLNPYKHKYHPDHDNLDQDFKNPRMEAYNITRAITLTFTLNDPTNLNLSTPGWGDTAMGGIYKEQITGLHRKPLFAEGNFRLTRVSDVGVLNDGK
jgi:hypothetical protein